MIFINIEGELIDIKKNNFLDDKKYLEKIYQFF